MYRPKPIPMTYDGDLGPTLNMLRHRIRTPLNGR